MQDAVDRFIPAEWKDAQMRAADSSGWMLSICQCVIGKG